MKTIGLLGGMSWESTATYYQLINQEINQRLGKMHSAKILLNSVDFEVIENFQSSGKWDEAGEELAKQAKILSEGGADFILICTNTMHKVFNQIRQASNKPVLHIADATADQLKASRISKVGLLGTAFTMEQDFYKGRIVAEHGIQILVPNEEDRELIHRVIYQELCLGKIEAESKRAYLSIVEKLASDGAEGIILGCTEIGLLISQEDTNVPIFDTTKIHALAAVEEALGK
ncbi:MAG: aspartate/glutamate racemase family protein [Kangiellaceae bacterium]|nr:aspartate/glutamate racemase family protein [Kangiellaceae bacterium]MCW9000271.1 aspartate/glutamate racemase family protein [Kangiellaceae bacterium]